MHKKVIFLLIFSLLLVNFHIVSSQTNDTISKKFTEKTDSIIEKEILLSENKAKIVRFLFGIKESSITVSSAIILIIIWIMALIGLKSLMRLTSVSFFQGEISSWVIATAINLLIATSGGMILAANIIRDIENRLGLIKEWSAGAFLFSLIFLGLVFFFLRKAFISFRKKEEKEKAEEEGRKIGREILFTRGVRDPYNLSN